MNSVTVFFKKYGVYIIIGIVGLWALMKFGKSSGNTQVVNRVIPVDNSTDRTALEQLRAQFQLGKLQLESGERIAEKQVAAERQRLDYANQALKLQGDYGIQALNIEAQKVQGQNDLQRSLASIALDQQGYDTQIRANAALELQRQAANQSYLNSLLGIGNGLLQSLFQRQQQQQSRNTPSGGVGNGAPGTGISPAQQAALLKAQQQSALARLGNWITRNFPNQNFIQSQNYPDLGYASGYDPSYVDSLSYYINYLDNLGVNDPIGSVTSSFEYLPFSGAFDFNAYANSQGYSDFDAFYNDYYGA